MIVLINRSSWNQQQLGLLIPSYFYRMIGLQHTIPTFVFRAGTSPDKQGLVLYYELNYALLLACPAVYCRQCDLVELLGEVQARYSIFNDKDPERLELVLNEVADIMRTTKAPIVILVGLGVKCYNLILDFNFVGGDCSSHRIIFFMQLFVDIFFVKRILLGLGPMGTHGEGLHNGRDWGSCLDTFANFHARNPSITLTSSWKSYAQW